jgi:hypothetical protein
MCHTITRTVCEHCGDQIGDAVLQSVACFPTVQRPAWGSAISTIEQHRAKRYKRTRGLCDECQRQTAVLNAAAVAESNEFAEADRAERRAREETAEDVAQGTEAASDAVSAEEPVGTAAKSSTRSEGRGTGTSSSN